MSSVSRHPGRVQPKLRGITLAVACFLLVAGVSLSWAAEPDAFGPADRECRREGAGGDERICGTD